MKYVGYLRPASGNPADGYLRRDPSPIIDGYLYPATGSPVDGYLRAYRLPAEEAGSPPAFPTQYAGLRYYHGTVKELCLVALADAPAGSQWRIMKGGVTYAVYLVDTSDGNASAIRVNTVSGVKAARLKT